MCASSPRKATDLLAVRWLPCFAWDSHFDGRPKGSVTQSSGPAFLIAPSARVVVVWGVLAGASAAVLLVVGGLSGRQTASIIAAAPFLLMMVGLCALLWRALLDELKGRRRGVAAA